MRRIPDNGVTGITSEEWFKSLEAASRRNDKGSTPEEIRKLTGWSLERVRRMIARAHDMGLVTRGKRTREGIDGRIYNSTVYMIRKPKGSR